MRPPAGWIRWLPPILVLSATAVVYLYAIESTPIVFGGDEAHSAIHAHAIATTGRDLDGTRLPLFFNVENPMPDRDDGARWWQPMYIYLQAAVLTWLPIADWSVRLPGTILALVNVGLVYAIAARLFGGILYPVLAALMLALTPAHFIFGRIALDYFAPVTFTLAWLYALAVFLDTGRLRALACGGLLLGIGVYSHLSAWAFMPLFLTLTWLAIWRSAQRPLPAMFTVTLGFLVPLLPLLIWTRAHPGMIDALLGSYQSPFMAQLTFLQKIREFLNYNNVQDKVSLYWNFFNPSFLFFAGGSNVAVSTRQVGVFLLPMSGLLATGLYALLKEARTAIVGLTLVVGFAAAPIPAVLRGESQAIQRELVLLPFAVLIGAYGLRSLLSSPAPMVRAMAVALLLVMPVQFAVFARDYFGDYQMRAAHWIDPVGFTDVGGAILAYESQTPLPAVYLASGLDDGGARWLFYLLEQGREDLWARTHTFGSSTETIADVPTGSLLVIYLNDPRFDALVRDGPCVVQASIGPAGGSPTTAILRKIQ